MLGALAKLLPVLTVVGGAAASSPNVKAQIAKVMETTRVIATQQEVSDIAKMIYLDTIDGKPPKPEELTEYLRTHMRAANNTKRDFSTDQWGTSYKLAYDKPRRELSVTSAGPDENFETADDIRGSYPLDQAQY
jgi:hypothetical protein